MARRPLIVIALAACAASLAIAAPAPELAATPLADDSVAVSAEAFLQRARQPVVAAAPAPAAANAASGYVPKTAHDNSPYRFDMTQNGRRMTAEEFDAWMKARGIRVATGKPAGSEAPAAAPAAATATAQVTNCAATATNC